MANIEKLKENPREQLLSHLDDVHMVMLGSPDPKQHMQPMAPQVDEESRTVWFFTRKSSDLAKALDGDDADVHLCIMEKDYQACITGELSVDLDHDKLERFWSPTVAAWFEGKSDPDLTMLRFEPKNASIWASDRNPVTFAWEIARSNQKDERKPDVGDRNSVNFH